MRIARAGSVAAMAVGLVLAAPAQGQQMAGMPSHEFGVDVGLVYRIIASPASGGSSATGFVVSTPVDVRVGFVSRGPLSFEGRLAASFTRLSSGGASVTLYTFAPDVNVLYKIGVGSGPHGLLGTYVTAGVGAGVSGYSNGSSNSGLNVTINAGVGTRQPFGSGAARGEFFVAYTPKNQNIGPLGNQLTIGLRLGVSLWH